MIRPTISKRRLLGHGVFFILLSACAAWSALALWFHLTGAALYLAWAALALCALVALYARNRARRWGWVVMAISALGVGGWYHTIRPSEDRDWAFDVAHSVKARVEGDQVQLADLRNFDWIDEDTANQRWESRSYDLSKLETVDMITSVWDSPDLAHLLVSFGFSDGEQVVFSVETRKESHESFSSLGGFFRDFELALIAASEEDIIKLRTNHRKEDVRLYPVALNAVQRRDLFLSYVDLAQQLERRPQFYNTLTANCTTTVYRLAQIIKPDMRPDWRLVLSGHLPAYVADLGGFSDELSGETRMARAAITEKAQAYEGDRFSQAIRRPSN